MVVLQCYNNHIILFIDFKLDFGFRQFVAKLNDWYSCAGNSLSSTTIETLHRYQYYSYTYTLLLTVD